MMNASIELRARFTQFLTGVEGAERTAASAPAAAGDVCILTGAAFYYKEMLLLSHMSKRRRSFLFCCSSPPPQIGCDRVVLVVRIALGLIARLTPCL